MFYPVYPNQQLRSDGSIAEPYFDFPSFEEFCQENPDIPRDVALQIFNTHLGIMRALRVYQIQMNRIEGDIDREPYYFASSQGVKKLRLAILDSVALKMLTDYKMG